MALDNRNITSADAIVNLLVEDIIPSGVTLQQFSVDTAVSQNEDTFAETRMGIDGYMVAGYTDVVKSVSITLEPSSPSVPYFEKVAAAMRAAKTVYNCTLIINLPSVGKVYTYKWGVLKTGKILPDLKTVLDPVTYTIDFESITVSDS